MRSPIPTDTSNSTHSTVISSSYIAGGSETGNISQDDISQDSFPTNAMLKWVGWFHTILF